MIFSTRLARLREDGVSDARLLIACGDLMHRPIRKRIFKVWITLFLFCAVSFSPSTFAQWGSNKEWMDLIRQDCSPTIKGRAKKLINEKSYWVEVSVSMDMWIEDMRLSRYDEYCRASYLHPSQRDRLMSCLASVRHDFDWFGRCKNQVTYMCRAAGGFCN
jgi:hypothetical protein